MAFDGVTVSAIVSELKKNLTGGRIYKIYQPEVDELCLVVKNRTEQGNTTSRLVISADASLPLIYLTGQIRRTRRQPRIFVCCYGSILEMHAFYP